MSTIKEQYRHPFPSHETAAAILTSARIMKEEQKNPFYWNFRGRPAIDTLDSYEESFRFFGRDLLHPTGRGFLRRFLEKKTAIGQPTFYLDLAGGDGRGMRDLARSRLITAGLTANLTDLRTNEQKAFDMQNGLCLVSGDLLRREAWNAIDSWLEIQSMKFGKEVYFDLITAWPGGAYNFNPNRYTRHVLHGTPPPAEAYVVLLKRVINRLAYRNGLLLAQVPASLYENPSSSIRVRGRDRKLKQFIRCFNEEHPNIPISFKEDLHDWNWDPEMPSPSRTWGCGIIKVQKDANSQFTIN